MATTDNRKFQLGQTVLVKHQPDTFPTVLRWVTGIVTDAFAAPVSGEWVYVVNGIGFYEGDVAAVVDDAA